MEELLAIGSQSLWKAALNEDVKAYILQNESLFNVLKRAANRYIGGENLSETVNKVTKRKFYGI